MIYCRSYDGLSHLRVLWTLMERSFQNLSDFYQRFQRTEFLKCNKLSFIIVQLMKQGNGKLQREVNISKEEVLCGLWAIRNSCSSISSNMVFREFQENVFIRLFLLTPNSSICCTNKVSCCLVSLYWILELANWFFFS